MLWAHRVGGARHGAAIVTTLSSDSSSPRLGGSAIATDAYGRRRRDMAPIDGFETRRGARHRDGSVAKAIPDPRRGVLTRPALREDAAGRHALPARIGRRDPRHETRGRGG